MFKVLADTKRLDPRNRYIRLLVEEKYFVGTVVEFTIRDVQARIHEMYIGDAKNAGLFFSFIDLSQPTEIELAGALHHEVRTALMKCGLSMSQVVSPLVYYDTGSDVIEDVLSVAVPGLQSIFASDHFEPAKKQENSLLLASFGNGSKSSQCVAKSLVFSDPAVQYI